MAEEELVAGLVGEPPTIAVTNHVFVYSPPEPAHVVLIGEPPLVEVKRAETLADYAINASSNPA